MENIKTPTGKARCQVECSPVSCSFKLIQAHCAFEKDEHEVDYFKLLFKSYLVRNITPLVKG